MKINHSWVNLEVSESMRSECETTFERTLFQFADRITNIDVVYSAADDNKVNVSAAVHGTNANFNVSYTTRNALHAIGEVADGIFDVFYKKRDINKGYRSERKLKESNTHQYLNSEIGDQRNYATILFMDSILDDIPDPTPAPTKFSGEDTPAWTAPVSTWEAPTRSWEPTPVSRVVDDTPSWTPSSSRSSWDDDSSTRSSSSWSGDSGSSWGSDSSSSSCDSGGGSCD